MCKIYLPLVCLCLALAFTECAPPASLILCKAEDSKCIKDSAVSVIPTFVGGLPEYGVEVLDPMKIKSINASEGNLLFTLSDVTVNGLKNCEAKKVFRDKSKSKIFLKIQCSASLDGDYVLKGSVLFVPVGGSGKVHADLKSAVLELDIDVPEKMGQDGKPHWNIKSYDLKYDFKEQSKVVFENLNKDNEVLERASRELIANNGNDIIKEIGSPVIRSIISRIVKNMNHFFKAVPADELSLS